MAERDRGATAVVDCVRSHAEVVAPIRVRHAA
jgi:hypothetical protein